MFVKTASSLILFWKTTKILTSYLFKNPLSSLFEESEKIVGAPNHSSWIIFSRQLIDKNEHPRVITYINIRLIQSCFSCSERTL